MYDLFGILKEPRECEEGVVAFSTTTARITILELKRSSSINEQLEA